MLDTDRYRMLPGMCSRPLHGWMDGWMDGYKDRQTDRQTVRQKDRQTVRYIDIDI